MSLKVHRMERGGSALPPISPVPAAPRRHSMVLSVLAILVTFAIVPLVSMGLWFSRDLEQELSFSQQETQLDKAKRLKNDITELVDGRFAQLGTLAALLETELQRGANMPQAEMIPALSDQMTRYLGPSDFMQLSLTLPSPGGKATLDGEGTPLEAALVDVNEPTVNPDKLRQDLDAELRDALLMGRRGTRYLSNPVLPDNRNIQPLCVFSVRMQVPDRRGWGVLTGVATMAKIQALVETEGHSSGGYTVFVLDSDQRAFAHTEFARVAEGGQLELTPLLHDFRTQGYNPSSRSFTMDTPDGEREMLGTSVPVLVEGGHRWGVFVQVDSRSGLDTVSKIRTAIVQFGLVSFVCALVIGVVFALRITGPIHTLTESTRRVAGGEYGRRVTVDRNNELGMLADNFNLMSEEVRQTVHDLEEQREENEQLFLSSIRSLAAAIDARDPYTRGHSERVTTYARIIAKQMQLSQERVKNIEIGALLHDVGKIGIEDKILRKPAALTPEEFEIMKTHPEKGGMIMTPIAGVPEVNDVIVHHHERWDGTGYPDGLAGEAIPLGARVVAVADTFDAMTTNRPYQRAMTFEVAASKIQSFVGKACDPRVVAAFIAALEAGEFSTGEAEAKLG